jgi:hypothetical protein
MGMFVTIPSDLVAQISVPASGILQDMMPVAVLAIGIFLGLMIISFVIGLFTRKND